MGESRVRAEAEAVSDAPTGRRLPRFVRWLHTYLSLFGFAATLLFAVTGLTLNHADWFEAAEPTVRSLQGELAPALLRGPLDKLALAEELRARHDLRGRVSDFQADDEQVLIVWKGPAYSADVTITRADGRYAAEESRKGFVALIDDLHKGRDSGAGWSLVIDVAAVVLIVISATGLWLLWFVRKRRRSGLWTTTVGAIALWLLYLLTVP